MTALCLTTGSAAQAAVGPLNFTVNMSEAVTVDTTGGTPRIALDVGGTPRYATYVSGSGTAALTFAYAPQPGDLDLDGIAITSATIDLQSGVINDLAGNPPTLSFTAPDTTSIRVNYPSLSFDFANSRYTLGDTVYTSFSSFLSAVNGTFTRTGTNGTYFDSTGVMRVAASGTPRFDHDPVTLAPRGLLMEGQRTNLLLRSDAFNNAAWIKGANTTIIADATTAPTGDTTADQYQTPVSSGSTAGQSLTLTAGTYTFSAYIKAGALSTPFRLGISTSSPTAISLDATNSTQCTPTTSWTRCSYTVALPTDGTYYMIADAPNATATDFYIWGAQLELGAFASSLMLTSFATETRYADVFQLTALGAWFSNSEGTLYTLSDNQATNTTGIVWLGEPANEGNVRVSLLYTGPTSIESMVSTSAGAQYQRIINSGNAYPATNKAAMAFRQDNFRSAVNGTLGTLDSSGAVPSTLNNARFGIWGSSGSGAMYGHLNMIRYYPARVIDAQLQQLTQ